MFIKIVYNFMRLQKSYIKRKDSQCPLICEMPNVLNNNPTLFLERQQKCKCKKLCRYGTPKNENKYKFLLKKESLFETI